MCGSQASSYDWYTSELRVGNVSLAWAGSSDSVTRCSVYRESGQLLYCYHKAYHWRVLSCIWQAKLRNRSNQIDVRKTSVQLISLVKSYILKKHLDETLMKDTELSTQDTKQVVNLRDSTILSSDRSLL